jgi:hypothetical protein
MDSVGIGALADELQEFTKTYGNRFKPSPRLVKKNSQTDVSDFY